MTNPNRWALSLGAAAALSAALVLQGCKPEHPEHPKTDPGTAQPVANQPAGKEHPEHPTAKPTLDDLEKHIVDYVNKNKDAGGKFKVEDDVEKKDLMTVMSKVHKERLSEVEPNLFFVCCDLKTDDGTTYDVDFWMKWNGKGFDYSKLKVHKVNGQPRYNWEEKDGKWHTVPLK